MFIHAHMYSNTYTYIPQYIHAFIRTEIHMHTQIQAPKHLWPDITPVTTCVHIHAHVYRWEYIHTGTYRNTEALIALKHLWTLLWYFKSILDSDLCSACVFTKLFRWGAFPLYSRHWAPASLGQWATQGARRADNQACRHAMGNGAGEVGPLVLVVTWLSGSTADLGVQ